ncbi:unnamed protein product [Prorocentrum cordatum]|uniref:Protein S-acyltransferase n=1 Tax=Prorocentrum cordatum TaxID=2364126 RepID=A0ABN9Y876_9DINO|nr:unnamed protein product [Polarella glacialis]
MDPPASLTVFARRQSADSGADSDAYDAPLVEKRAESGGPYVLGCLPFFVVNILKMKDAEKICSRSHCIGPVIKLAMWCPLVHASVMFCFMGVGLLHMSCQNKNGGPLSKPEWFLPAGASCIALMLLEVYIAKYSSILCTDKASKQFGKKHENEKRPIGLSHCPGCRIQKESKPGGPLSDPEAGGVLECRHCGKTLRQGRLPVGWPCMPVTVIDALLSRCCFSGVRARWHEEQEKLYFNVWFLWLFVLGTITVYGRLQANTFLGMVLYGFLTGNRAKATDQIWKETLSQSYFIRHFHFPLEAILLAMAVAQICHYAFGVLSYCPRWAWKTAAHKRWQYGENGGLGRWSPWGRSFEFEVKGIEKDNKQITDMSRWQQWMDGFEGATAMVTTSRASSANGKDVFITVPRGGPAKAGEVEYTPSDADFPISVEWTTNRHAYTTLFGGEMTSSTVMDVIAECCSMGILLEMQCLELHEHAKAAGLLTKYQGEGNPTEKMSGELIQAVRPLMNSAVNITRCAFSRVFIYGVCFCGTNLHFQTTYANVLCVSSASESCNGAKALWVGIGAAFVSMLLVLAKIVSIAKYQRNVWAIYSRYQKVLKSEHAGLHQFSSFQGQIQAAKCRLVLLSALLFSSSVLFVWIFVWLLFKWYMETFVCESRMWNIPAKLDMTDIMSGCVNLN